MKTPTLFAQFFAVAVLGAPLSLPATINDETIEELHLTNFVEPIFPDSLRIEGIADGSATVAVSRNAAGDPVDILVLRSSHHRLALAAVEAIRQWRFAPAKSTGPVPCIVRVGFRLEGVVVFPYGKKPASGQDYARTGLEHQRVNVPRLQALSQVPKALTQPMPQYPAALANQGLQGTAAVRFYVDEDGRVRLPEVVEATTPEFADAALAAVSQWRYEPPHKDGRSIVAVDRWEFKFQAVN